MPIFGRKEKVPLNNDTMMKCMCGMCPVQAQSACSAPKLKMMMDMRASMGMKGQGMPAGSMSAMPAQEMKIPNPEQLPGPFCSIGKAACNDLDRNKACICNTCQVYRDYNLMSSKPIEHFCFNGKAT